MPRICAVYGCNNSAKMKGLSLYGIPSVKYNEGNSMLELTKKRQRLWLKAINRADLTIENIKYYHQVCCDHFVTGRPAYYRMDTDPDWIPTKNLSRPNLMDRHLRQLGRLENKNSFLPENKERGTHLVTETKTHMDDSEEKEQQVTKINEPRDADTINSNKDMLQDVGTQADLTMEMTDQLEKTKSLRQKVSYNSFDEEEFRDNDDNVKFYTGQPASLFDDTNPDWVPTLNLGPGCRKKGDRRKELLYRETSSNAEHIAKEGSDILYLELTGKEDEEMLTHNPKDFTYINDDSLHCSNADCVEVKHKLLRDLHDALYEERQLKAKIEYLERISNINIDLLHLCLDMDQSSEVEMEFKKVIELVEIIMNPQIWESRIQKECKQTTCDTLPMTVFRNEQGSAPFTSTNSHGFSITRNVDKDTANNVINSSNSDDNNNRNIASQEHDVTNPVIANSTTTNCSTLEPMASQEHDVTNPVIANSTTTNCSTLEPMASQEHDLTNPVIANSPTTNSSTLEPLLHSKTTLASNANTTSLIQGNITSPASTATSSMINTQNINICSLNNGSLVQQQKSDLENKFVIFLQLQGSGGLNGNPGLMNTLQMPLPIMVTNSSTLSGTANKTILLLHPDHNNCLSFCKKCVKSNPVSEVARPEKSKLLCELCGKAMRCSASVFGLHMRRAHTKEKPFQCGKCGKRFYAKYTLTKHNLGCQNNERSHQCEDCGKLYRRIGNLKQHRVMHDTNARIYDCPQCNYKTRWPCNVRLHMKNCHQGSIASDYCSGKKNITKNK